MMPNKSLVWLAEHVGWLTFVREDLVRGFLASPQWQLRIAHAVSRSPLTDEARTQTFKSAVLLSYGWEEDSALQFRAAWLTGLKGLAFAVVLILLLLPRALDMVASYRIGALEMEHQRLENQRAALELEEAVLASQDRLKALASQMHLHPSSPVGIVYLAPDSTGTMALNLTIIKDPGADTPQRSKDARP